MLPCIFRVFLAPGATDHRKVDDGGFTLLGMTADSGFASIRPTGRSLVGFSPD